MLRNAFVVVELDPLGQRRAGDTGQLQLVPNTGSIGNVIARWEVS